MLEALKSFFTYDLEQFRSRFEDSMIAAGKASKLKMDGKKYSDPQTQSEWEDFAEAERQAQTIW